MPIISQETWDKFSPEEKENIRDFYKGTESEILKTEYMELFGKENLQPQLTYEDVVMNLFKNGAWQYGDGYMGSENGYFDEAANELYPLNMTSKEQAEKLLAINKLLNVAKFLNKDWKPDWRHDEDKWSLCVDPDTNKVKIIKVYHSEVNRYIVYFRTEELAKQAVQILGEETVRLALSSDY